MTKWLFLFQHRVENYDQLTNAGNKGDFAILAGLSEPQIELPDYFVSERGKDKTLWTRFCREAASF